MSFYATLTSDASLQYHSENKLNHFFVRLPKPIDLIGEWEVGLSEIIYPHAWYNITEETNYFVISHGKDVFKKIRIPCGFYDTAEELIKTMMQNIKDKSPTVKFSYNKHNKKVRVYLKEKSSLLLYKGIAENLGFPPGALGHVLNEDNPEKDTEKETRKEVEKEAEKEISSTPAPKRAKPLQRGKSMQPPPPAKIEDKAISKPEKEPEISSNAKKVSVQLKGGTKLTLPRNAIETLGVAAALADNVQNDGRVGTEVMTILESPFVADPLHDFHFLYVYTDICEDVIVGDVLAPLLRIVKVEGRQQEMVCTSYDRPHYVPLMRKNFETIEVVIRTHTGKLVSFERGRVIVKLHFRLKQL